MSAVAADVGERPHDLVLIAYQQDALGAGADRALCADTVEVGGVPDTVPAGEDIALLPLEHVRVDVGLARQHSRGPKRRQRRGKSICGERGRIRLFEHAVKNSPLSG